MELQVIRQVAKQKDGKDRHKSNTKSFHISYI